MVTIAQAFAVLPASDLQRARTWYAEKLGIEPAMDLDGTLVYQFGASQVGLYQTRFAGTAKNTAAGLVVANLDEAMTELRSRGVTFEDYDIEGGPKTVDGVSGDDASGKSAWFTDSEGNIVNLVQLPPGFPAG